jgi:hypothetical protein
MLVGYMQVSTDADRQVLDLQRDALLAAGVDEHHLSPLGWEYVNLTGDYVWGGQKSASENSVGLRPLRTAPELNRKAA